MAPFCNRDLILYIAFLGILCFFCFNFGLVCCQCDCTLGVPSHGHIHGGHLSIILHDFRSIELVEVFLHQTHSVNVMLWIPLSQNQCLVFHLGCLMLPSLLKLSDCHCSGLPNKIKSLAMVFKVENLNIYYYVCELISFCSVRNITSKVMIYATTLAFLSTITRECETGLVAEFFLYASA